MRTRALIENRAAPLFTHTEIPCGACGQPVLVTITSSLTKSDGTPWMIFHGACYKPMKENKNEHD